jgi:DNA-binding transcriptional MerR regulator
MAERGHLSIGEVLSLVQEEFPDITISKIRFLESQGLLDPERTPSGYRKFYDADIERLQWILTQQRDHFLPLKVIRDRLAEWDATGQRPAAEPGSGPSEPDDAEEHWDETPPEVAVSVAEPESVPSPPVPDRDDAASEAAAWRTSSAIEVVPREPEPAPVEPPAAPGAPSASGPDERSLTAQELADRAGVDVSAIHELEGFSMISSRRIGPETYYDVEQLAVVEACRAFLDHGVEVRHLRMYKIAAEREAGVLEQLIMPLLKQRNPEARSRAVAMVSELADAGEALHASLLRHALRHTLPDRG